MGNATQNALAKALSKAEIIRLVARGKIYDEATWSESHAVKKAAGVLSVAEQQELAGYCKRLLYTDQAQKMRALATGDAALIAAIDALPFARLTIAKLDAYIGLPNEEPAP